MNFELQAPNGKEILHVSPQGEFIWHPDAGSLINQEDFSNCPAIRFILKKLWDFDQTYWQKVATQDSTNNTEEAALGVPTPKNCIIFYSSGKSEVLRLEEGGHIFWNGQEVIGDDEFKVAMVDLLKVLKSAK